VYDFALWIKAGLVAWAFEEPYCLQIIKLASEVGAFPRYSPGTLFVIKKDEVRAYEKIARDEGGLDFNHPRFDRNLKSKKTQDGIAKGQQAQDKKKTASARGCLVKGAGGWHDR
jgi:hypothetical protein